MQSVKIEAVKNGEYIKRTETARAVYVRGAYDKKSKSFECMDADDMNRVIYIKSGKPVFVGFTY